MDPEDELSQIVEAEVKAFKANLASKFRSVAVKGSPDPDLQQTQQESAAAQRLVQQAEEVLAQRVNSSAGEQRGPDSDEHSLHGGTSEAVAKLQALEAQIAHVQQAAVQHAEQSEVARGERIVHEFAALKADDAAAVGTPAPAQTPVVTSTADLACTLDLDAKIVQFQLMAERSE